ncbi:tRNA A37 threonylcarbamoyladenosine dehydratase [Clostridium moniliforme]|uniref:tRNA A37 threonylcarbamoyladenosine dehydratase n=1 Tax=Clostridium moniliforme TaxID=39489 RepID=A0ABS4F2W0_9CLOT|nr:tRNA threonylcarbamoyladenosine dehydratase [Clostridium moniliforme]MBP1890564.1 tRNA A37 threonylcarbamoyladenosine dehydratase [Clostridium moniliforme]
MTEHSLSRIELLIGKEGLDKLKKVKVVVFGVGGVGSFTVEALARAGVGTLVLIDNDTVSISNLNRQIHANYNTVDKVKVDVMKERILSINKDCNVITHQTFVTPDNIKDFIDDDVDYVVDAIDTVTAKIAIAKYCYENDIKIISSMGTGNKFDPTQFKVSDVFKTKVCPLAKVMRRELKNRGVKKLKVVYSEELPVKPNAPEEVSEEKKEVSEDNGKINIVKRQTPGSMPFVPSVAGMIIGGEVIKDIIGMNNK